MSKGRIVFNGALAGVISTLVFTIVHQIFISPIWFMLWPMVFAGAFCGALLSWSYRLLVTIPTRRGWLGYNLVYVLMFGLLGAASVLIFEPVTTMAAVVTFNGPPTELIDQAMPMTVVFTLGMAVLITLLYGRSIPKFIAVLLTCTVLVALLGLNISAIGLVEIPRGSLAVIAELFGLIVALNAVYALGYLALEPRLEKASAKPRYLFHQTSADTGGEYLEMEVSYPPHSSRPPSHYHPYQEEHFEVLRGTFRTQIGDLERTYETGETFRVPPNTPHWMHNISPEEGCLLWQVRPALKSQAFFETMWGLAANGKTDAHGRPTLLQLAVILQEYSQEFRVTSPPYWVQRILFGVLSPIGKLLGYRASYPRYTKAD